MGGLDGFFSAASRLTRRRPGFHAGLAAAAPPNPAAVEALLRDATELLPRHPERAAEIAFQVQRLAPLLNGASDAILPFSRELAVLAASRLADAAEGPPPSRVQAREALVSYVALHDLARFSSGENAVIPDEFAKKVAEGLPLLDAPALAAALAKVGPEMHEAASLEVLLGLQRPFADGELLESLNESDFLAVLAGLARATETLPEAAVSVVREAGRRLGGAPDAMSAAAVYEATRLLVDLQRRCPSERAAIDQVLTSSIDSIAALATAELAAASEDSTRAAATAAGLGRVAAALLPEGGPIAEAFAAKVLQPVAPSLAEVVRADFDAFELVSQLVRSAGEPAVETWGMVLAHAALEGLPTVERSTEGTERLLRILEGVAASAADPAASTPGKPAFPPFFDFALEEVLGRMPELDQRQLRRIAKIFSEAHLERVDLLPAAAMAMSSAAIRQRVELRQAGSSSSSSTAPLPVADSEQVTDVALDLSAFAALFVRLAKIEADAVAARAADAAAGKAPAAARNAGPDPAAVVGAVLDADGIACEELLRRQVAGEAEASRGAAAADAASSLALSAFAQVIVRAPRDGVPPETTARLQARGLALLEALSAAWSSDKDAIAALSVPQMHIFVTALRAFCTGARAPSAPPPAAAGVLRALLAQLSAAPQGDREAQLMIAMFGELAKDPGCPEPLRAMLPKDTAPDPTQAQGATAAAAAAGGRLRQHVRSVAATEEATQRPQAASGGFLSRIFGRG
eukprot:TRINITY_DN70659_c0_g1_i1.p1 TRINITY_DN70659_c0_g1~~TRINITY_DN70659_c0_g1_i1.p1  ORF type:complete len:748 (-),score=178.93 TRINITY_DN70659_c0_g1_i1:233-2476(-)